MSVEGHVSEGADALRTGRWADARAAFEAALTIEESVLALEGLADAHWWLCNARASVRYRERAWVAARRAGDIVAAGRAAIDLCISYLVNLGNDAAARGWLGRAERATRDLEPNPLEGWVLLMRGYLSPAAEHARTLTERAMALGHAIGDSDLELLALSDLGLAHVVHGSADDGMAMLDEALAGALAGECCRLDTVVFALCNMLAACHLVRDVDRATKWCDVAEEFMRSYGSPFLYARCRTHYGGVLLAKGQWHSAEEQFHAALDMAADAGPGPRIEALAHLADLRLRQGRLEEAEALLALVEDSGDVVLPAAAARLARGEPATAAALLERRTRLLEDTHIELGPTLMLLVQAHLADGNPAGAAAAQVRLQSVASAQKRPAAMALALLASAHVAEANGAMADAAHHLERALEEFSRLGLPLETARVRFALARMLAHDHPPMAISEAKVAHAVFERLGASADADEAARLLRSLGASAQRRARGRANLTRREQEVLDLVALGLTNPEIAARLYISRKTASHHVSNVLSKLGVRNRAEAAAHAVSPSGRR